MSNNTIEFIHQSRKDCPLSTCMKILTTQLPTLLRSTFS